MQLGQGGASVLTCLSPQALDKSSLTLPNPLTNPTYTPNRPLSPPTHNRNSKYFWPCSANFGGSVPYLIPMGWIPVGGSPGLPGVYTRPETMATGEAKRVPTMVILKDADASASHLVVAIRGSNTKYEWAKSESRLGWCVGRRRAKAVGAEVSDLMRKNHKLIRLQPKAARGGALTNHISSSTRTHTQPQTLNPTLLRFTPHPTPDFEYDFGPDIIIKSATGKTIKFPGRIHRGFQDGFHALWPSVAAALNSTDVKHVTVAGHSQGSGIGVFLSYAVSRLGG